MAYPWPLVILYKVIEKYNKLNMEGKLPHIVESSHFNPEAVK